MKKIIILLIIAAFIQIDLNAQPVGGKPRDGRKFKKIEQLEKAKLIEILDLDEEKSIRFFARRNEYLGKQREYMRQRRDILREIKDGINDRSGNDEFYKDRIMKLQELEKRILAERETFLKSLSGLLTMEQIAKLTVFEFDFRRELAETIMGRGKPNEE